MKFEQIDVDPAFAAGLLEASAEVQQRTLVKRRVQTLVHDMRNGNFRLTHQPIAIDDEGRVIDGQHRLTAVIQSGVTVPMMIAYDVDETTFGVIDTGRARTPGDALKIAGMTNVNVKASVARLVLAYDVVKGTTQSFGTATREFTSADVQHVFETERGERILQAEAPASRIASALGRYGLKTWAAATYVIVTESDCGESTKLEFFERLTDGALQQPGSPILALRRYCINDTGIMIARTHDRPAMFIANALRTLNDYMIGRERAAVLWRMGRDVMPEVHVPDPALLELDAEARERALKSEASRDYRARKSAKAKAS